MHGALRSLIIPCVFTAMALGSSSLQARDGEFAEPSAQVQVQEQPAQAAPEQAQAKEQIQEQLASQSESAPEQSSPSQPAEPREQQAAHATPEQSSPSQPAEPREQQASHATPEQSAQQTPEPAAKVDLSSYEPGTIVVETSERKLHLVLGQGEMLTYPVGVGKSGKSWAGTGAIRGKFLRPAWSPPRALKREKPWTPDYIPGGSPKNPMGAAAMTLNVDQYAIHGTNDPGSIGGFVSFGCIRMHNRDILDLYKRVHVGTRVVVLR
jgi:lipoprotein-anchoring transpeptidase ErfK/SrfK